MSEIATFNWFRIRSFRVLVGSRRILFRNLIILYYLRTRVLNTTVSGVFPIFHFLFLRFRMFFSSIIHVSYLINCILVRLNCNFMSRLFCRTRRRYFVMFRFTILRFAFCNFFNRLYLTNFCLFSNLTCFNSYLQDNSSIRPITFKYLNI